jgi:hypothetical protein
MILVQAVAAHWRRSFGDPDLLGWIITAAYLVAAALCARAALVLARRETGPTSARGWAWLAAVLALLGVNKQLDLQILLRDAIVLTLSAAGWHRWYERHRPWLAGGFVLALGIVFAAAAYGARRRLAAAARRNKLAAAGVVLLVCFILIRAGSSAPVLHPLNGKRAMPLHLALELGGVCLIGASALRSSHRSRGRA